MRKLTKIYLYPLLFKHSEEILLRNARYSYYVYEYDEFVCSFIENLEWQLTTDSKYRAQAHNAGESAFILNV